MSLVNTLKFITSHPLNRENKARAVARFLKWQVGSRLVQGSVVYEWVNGSKFFVRTGETGLTGNIYVGLHEFSDMGFLLHFLRREDLFVDVGANAGSYSILAGSAVGAKCIAFEPVPTTYERLVQNLRLNRLEQRVQSINKGVGAREGKTAFSSDGDTTSHVITDEQRRDAVVCEITTLDAALDEVSPSMVKIDVEGFEMPVLEGAQNALSQESLYCVIMELNGSGRRYGYDDLQLLEHMQDYGFKTYSYDPFNRRLIYLRGKNLESGNTLFLRNESLVEERLISAPSVLVNDRLF